MCRKKYFDALSVGLSILIGIAFALLALYGLLNAVVTSAIVGLALGAFSLLLLLIAAASLLQQNNAYNDCLCRGARKLLLGAVWLMVVCVFTIAFALTSTIVVAILSFLIFSLMSYVFFTLYCWLKCLLSVGCEC